MANAEKRSAETSAPVSRLSVNDPRVRGLLYQALVIGLVVAGAWYLIANALANLARQSIATGFSFLDRRASFDIAQHLISYSAASSYLRAYEVGLLNTLLVAVLGIILATAIGTAIGILRLSSNWLISRLAAAYVEVTRNIPLLLQLFFWYDVITVTLPGPRQALSPVPGVFLSNRGFMLPVPVDGPVWGAIAIALLIGAALSVGLRNWARRRQDATGQQFPIGWAATAFILGLPILTWLFNGAPTAMEVPELRGFGFQGGITMSPELVTILLGLAVYTSAFIAEIVRAGILAVSSGQSEAALALGLRRGQILRLVILPQAFRVMVPQLTSEFLSLTKNSSLAVAIGYPDLVSISNTAINQTGQAIEGIAIIMVVYLTLSLLISAFMNWFNKRVALRER